MSYDDTIWWMQLNDEERHEYEEWLDELDNETKRLQEKQTMKFPAKGSGNFEIVPAGNHVAICNMVVDLGVQQGRGMYPDPKHEVYIRFELPTEQITYEKDGKELTGPMSIGRRFTASMSEKANLRKFIESWFGKRFPSDDDAAAFDLQKLLGYKCLLNVTHTEKGDKTYANISNATPIPKGMQADYEQHNKSVMFDLSEPDQDAFDALPEWLQKTVDERLFDNMEQRVQNAVQTRQPPVAADLDDDIPF